MLAWVSKVTGDPVHGAVQLDLALRDGVRICQLMAVIMPDCPARQPILAGTIEASIKPAKLNKVILVSEFYTCTRQAHRTNIQQFLREVEQYGVPDRFLFQVRSAGRYHGMGWVVH